MVRFVQLTPPGSACSIAFGKGLTDMTPFVYFSDPDGNAFSLQQPPPRG